MIFHDYYSDIPRDDVDRLVQSQELARLVTVGDDGMPHVGLYPFVYDGKTLDLHLVRSDEQIKDLKARPRCVLEVDEVLAVIPSYWVHPEYAGAATAYHRTVIFECEARVEEDPDAVAAPAYSECTQYDGITARTSSTSSTQRGRAFKSLICSSDLTRCKSTVFPS